MDSVDLQKKSSLWVDDRKENRGLAEVYESRKRNRDGDDGKCLGKYENPSDSVDVFRIEEEENQKLLGVDGKQNQVLAEVDESEKANRDDNVYGSNKFSEKKRYVGTFIDTGVISLGRRLWIDRQWIEEQEKLLEENDVECSSVGPCPVNRHWEEDYVMGVPMMEVYKVRIVIEDRTEAQNLCPLDSSSRLHGVIKMKKCGQSEFTMYEVKKDQPKIIDLSKNSEIILPLSGPHSLPSICLSNWEMTFALKLNGRNLFEGSDKYPVFNYLSLPVDGHRIDEKFDGEDISVGRVFFPFNSLFSLPACSFHTNIVWGETTYSERKDSEAFPPYPIKVYLDYGLLSSAVAAKVQVTILNEYVTHVSGHIFARSCIMDAKTVLFDMEQGDPVLVESHSHVINLARSVVAVPSDSYFQIEAKLCDVGGTCFVDETFHFRPYANGRFVSKVDNAVEIEVDWWLGG